MLKTISILLYLLLIFKKFDVEAARGKLIWSDEFNSADDLKAKWKPGWLGNVTWAGLQHYYTNKNYFLDDTGNLVIEARKENFSGREYTSSIVRTIPSFTYGVIEMRAKLPRGNGTRPSFWLLPNTGIGEIDIFEHEGCKPGKIASTLHTNGTVPGRYNRFINIKNEHTEYHNYTLEWGPDKIAIYADRTKILEYKKAGNEDNWPFDKPYYIQMNISIGAYWMAPIDPTVFPQRYVIDYLRIYEYV